MKPASQGVKVTIMGREFTVACPDEERDALTRAATNLDDRMREIQKSGKVVSLERCAIIAALNVINELLYIRDEAKKKEELGERMKALQEKLDSAMQEQLHL